MAKAIYSVATTSRSQLVDEYLLILDKLELDITHEEQDALKLRLIELESEVSNGS